MKFIRLAEVVKELESGARPKGGVSSETGTIPSLGAEHLSEDGGFNFHKNKFITVEFFNSLKSGKVKGNDILIVKDGATTGKVSFVQNDFPFPNAAINEHVFRIAIDQHVGFSKFVYFFLRSSEGKKQILNDFRGATVGGISRQFIEATKIPLPPLADQIRIAAVLTRAEKLIAKRKESIKALDELLKSTFVEKFINKNYPLEKLANLTHKITDGEHKKPDYKEFGMPFISVVNISKGILSFENCKFISDEDHIKFNKRCNPETDDILYTKVGATYGKAVIVDVDKPFSLYVSVALIKPNKIKINPLFLTAAMNHPFLKRQADKAIKGAGVPDLHLIEIKNFLIPNPPKNEQNDFALFVKKVESLKAKYTKSLTELENLYGSLSQRAFKGKLDLSGVTCGKCLKGEKT